VKQTIIALLLSSVAMNGALADYQSVINRRNIDLARYHKYRSKYELDMFKEQHKRSKKKLKEAEDRAEAYTAWSQADAALFNHEQKMFKAGIRTTNYTWDKVEQARASGRLHHD
jgi:phosphoribosylanthranilate isomerase